MRRSILKIFIVLVLCLGTVGCWRSFLFGFEEGASGEPGHSQEVEAPDSNESDQGTSEGSPESDSNADAGDRVAEKTGEATGSLARELLKEVPGGLILLNLGLVLLGKMTRDKKGK